MADLPNAAVITLNRSGVMDYLRAYCHFRRGEQSLCNLLFIFKLGHSSLGHLQLVANVQVVTVTGIYVCVICLS